MKDIISAWELSATETARWRKAADTWRMPYWDWARKQQYTENFALPKILTARSVEIFPPESIKERFKNLQKYPNPLFGYENPEKDKTGSTRAFGNMPTGKEMWNIRDNTGGKQTPNKPANEGCFPVSDDPSLKRSYHLTRTVELGDSYNSLGHADHAWKCVHRTRRPK